MRSAASVLGYPVLGTDADLAALAVSTRTHWSRSARSRRRSRAFACSSCCNAWLQLPVIVSPHAYVSRHATVDAGTIVMHGAVVNAGAVVGRNCILNSQSLVEHDAVIDDHCHVATSAVINSGVRVGAALSSAATAACAREFASASAA